jgi:hypothetical protein
MSTPAYILGALDVLVKTGAVSPDYAAGAASVFVKQAGLFGDTAAQNMEDNYTAWREQNPHAEMTPEKARELALQSRNWYSRAFSPNAGWGNWFSNRMGKWTRGIRSFFGASNVPSAEQYDRELQDMENQNLSNYMSEHNHGLPPEVAGALQEGFIRDAHRRVLDAKDTMTEMERIDAGLTDDYIDQYKSIQGNTAIRGGAYKPKYDKAKIKATPQPGYGKKVPKSFGANSTMFYNVGYTNPLSS